ncbi:MAG TPA: GTPase Era [Azospirillaceae bacterium]|nr:GTPase Era [Azospirillaceae bacterium]
MVENVNQAGDAGGTDDGAGTRCGFVALVGAPNAGKSTLLNALVGAKISIVSPRVQTTRSRVLGITIEGTSQLVFVDTPGIFRPKRRLDRAMVAAAWQGTEDADLTVLLFDSSHSRIDDDTRAIVDKLKAAGRRAILALTKIDLIRRQKLLALAQEMNELGDFTDTFMISAVTGSGLPELRKVLAGRMPEGPWLFEEDQLSDMPMRLIAAEMTREQVFLQLYQELPYAVAVETEEWEEFDDGSVRIGQAITVEREGQKAIVLGKGGSRIKAIGQAARQEIEKLLERRVHLKLFVKVRESWQDDPDHYRPWGLDYNA